MLMNNIIYWVKNLVTIITDILNPATVVSVIAIFVGSRNVTKQIRISRQPLLVFKIQDVENNVNKEDNISKTQIVENVGLNVAVNVNIYRSFLDNTRESFWYKKIYSLSPVFLKNRVRKNLYPFAKITLEESLGTIKVDGKKDINLLPLSHSYEIFIVQYQDMLGNYYQTLLRPQNGRGDFEKVVPPRKIRSKNVIKNTFIGHGEEIILPRFLKDGYNK